MTYVDGFVIPIAEGKVDDYRKMAEKASEIWMDHGALLYKECVMEDGNPVMEGAPPEMKMVTFPQLAGLNKGETIIFAFIVFKSRAHRDEVNKKVMADPRLHEACSGMEMPFDCNRMSYAGFKTIVEK